MFFFFSDLFFQWQDAEQKQHEAHTFLILSSAECYPNICTIVPPVVMLPVLPILLSPNKIGLLQPNPSRAAVSDAAAASGRPQLDAK